MTLGLGSIHPGGHPQSCSDRSDDAQRARFSNSATIINSLHTFRSYRSSRFQRPTSNNIRKASTATSESECIHRGRRVGHQDYWDDVCEAQAGRDVGQDLGLLKFGVDFGEGSRTSHDRPVTAEAVVISDDHSIDLSEVPDLSAEPPEKNDDDEIRKRTFRQFHVTAQGLRHPHRNVRTEDIALGSLAIDVAGPYKEGFEGFRDTLIGVFTFQHAGPGLSFVKLLRNRKLDTVLTATEQIQSPLMYLGGDRSPVVRLHSDNALEFVAERFSTEIKNKGYKGIFKTVTVPRNPASTGRAERQVQASKRAALQFLLERHLERRFWPQCLLEAAACQHDACFERSIFKQAVSSRRLWCGSCTSARSFRGKS